MLSNQRLTLKSHIPISFGVWDTFKIFETGLDVVEGSIVFSNKVQLERLVVNIDTDWTCEIVMRWLDNTEIKNEDPSLKRDWDIWANGYITVFASDIFDKDSELPQTIKAPFTFEKEVTFKDAVNFDEWLDVTWPVKPFPQVDDETERDNMYPNPTWWEVAIVWGYLQIFNPETQQRETLDVWTPPPQATETAKGIMRIATEEEALAWSNDTVAMTPKKVKELTTTEIEASEASLTDNTFMLWEPCTKWDSLFKEVWPTFAQATTEQNIGDVAGNTRVSIPVIWSGVAGNSLKLALAKVDDLWEDLTLRIETDNAGEPSWTAVTDWTATITRASLTTSLTDETITLAWTIILTEWTKYHIVLAQEWDEVDPARYFKVGLVDKNTTTRNCKFFDGTNWVDNNPAENNAHWVALTSTLTSIGPKFWLKLKAKKDLQINSINLVSGGSQPTKAYIEYPIWTTVETANITALVATFTWTTIIPAGENFAIVVDNDWWTFTNYYLSWTFPYSFNYLDITGGYRNVLRLENIESINVTAVWWFSYSSSDLFTEWLLSLTDARLPYKLPNDIPRFAKSNWVIWEKVKCSYLGIADLFSWLTEWSDYFLQNTPWAIGATAGTNMYRVWQAIDDTQLELPTVNYKVMTISRQLEVASWTVTYSHNMWKRPKLIQIYWTLIDMSFKWAWDWVNQVCTTYWDWNWKASSTQIILMYGADNSSIIASWIISNITNTTFDISRTKISPLQKTCQMTVILQA